MYFTYSWSYEFVYVLGIRTRCLAILNYCNCSNTDAFLIFAQIENLTLALARFRVDRQANKPTKKVRLYKISANDFSCFHLH